MAEKEQSDLLDFSGLKRNRLYKYVIKDVLATSRNYEVDTDLERVKARLNDVDYGLSCGVVGSLSHYDETTRFFKRHRRGINELLSETLRGLGEPHLCGVFGKKWDEKDPLALEKFNQNLLAWFAYEEIAEQMRNHLEERQ
jgi:hypothetical protein